MQALGVGALTGLVGLVHARRDEFCDMRRFAAEESAGPVALGGRDDRLRPGLPALQAPQPLPLPRRFGIGQVATVQSRLGVADGPFDEMGGVGEQAPGFPGGRHGSEMFQIGGGARQITETSGAAAQQQQMIRVVLMNRVQALNLSQQQRVGVFGRVGNEPVDEIIRGDAHRGAGADDTSPHSAF